MSDESDAWDSAQEGAELVGEGEFDTAVQVLSALIERQPSNEYAYFYLGCALFELGEYARALKAYVQALTLVPTYMGAMIHAGHTLRMLGRYNEAIRMGSQVLARSADDPDALYLIGASCFASGLDAKATEYLTRFLHTDPELEVATEVEGMLQTLRGKITELN
jgi:tetratricopeptide (TPR) repeat protein